MTLTAAASHAAATVSESESVTENGVTLRFKVCQQRVTVPVSSPAAGRSCLNIKLSGTAGVTPAILVLSL